VLRELADDAEALYEELRTRGLSQEAAADRVREVLLPGGAAREALRAVHATLYQRIAHRFSAGAMLRWERASVGVLVFAAVAGGTAALRNVPLLLDPSPWLVPLMAIGGAGLLMGLAKCFQLFIKGVRDVAPLRAGLAPLLAAAGVCADLYRVAARMEAAHDPTGRVVLAFVRADSTLLAVGLTLSLAIGLGWFLLLQWVTAIEAADRRSLERGVVFDPSSGGARC
jgi:hypothetical protein